MKSYNNTLFVSFGVVSSTIPLFLRSSKLVLVLTFLINATPVVHAEASCLNRDGYAMYVWRDAFDPTAPACNGIYPDSKTGANASCFYHAWETAVARKHLWKSCMMKGREVTRIFLADVKSRIENNGLNANGQCDTPLVQTLKEAHQRGIEVYALFAVSDGAFSEQNMASYAHEFNIACGSNDNFVSFDGVAVNNEHFSTIKTCNDPVAEQAQLQLLDDLSTTVANALPLPLHFSVSWNWDCCNCSFYYNGANYVSRNLDWNGSVKTALEHMIHIVDSVDVQVAYNLDHVMLERSNNPYQYWQDAAKNTSTTKIYILAYTNPVDPCQLSFSPHKVGSTTVTDTCNSADRTEAGMYDAFDFIEQNLPEARGGIHFMGGVYSTGITSGWPKHNGPTCPLGKRWDWKKKSCVNSCGKGKTWNWNKCMCTCPICKKWNGTKCVNRCRFSTKKWFVKQNRCIWKGSSNLGYIWNTSSQNCVLV